MKIQKTLLVLLLCLLTFSNLYALSQPNYIDSPAISVFEKYYRTELYFGRSKSNGTVVSEDEWTKFLKDEVTPRFPDGFTVLDGAGQYRDKNGRIVKEPSKVLVFLYTRKNRKTSSTKIDEIRTAYVKLFSQESVLRLDFKHSVNVLF